MKTFICDICGREVNSCFIVNDMKFCVKCFQKTFSDKDKEIVRLIAENAELRARLEKAVELPANVMIKRILVDEKIKIKKEQAFNWKIGTVCRDETRWNGLLVDVCSEKGGKDERYTVVFI